MTSRFSILLMIFCCCCCYCQAWTIPLPGGGKISFEPSDGLLRIQTQPQPAELEELAAALTIQSQMDPLIQPSTIVKDTGTVKGYGVYWTDEKQQALPKHTFLGFYEGTPRSSLEGLENTEYIMSLDGGQSYVDGYDRAQDRSVFSPVHFNHQEAPKANCVRMLLRLDDANSNSNNQSRQCAFFTSRDIECDEELTFDYGENYWRGRESEKI